MLRNSLLKKASALALSGIIALFPMLSLIPHVEQAEAATALAPHVFKEQIAHGSTFYLPTDFAIAPDGRIFVAEKNGEIRIVKNGAVLPQPFTCSPPSASNQTHCPVTIGADVYGERGLLGITLDTNFATNHSVYVMYVNASPLEYHVSRFTEANDQAVAGSENVLFKTSLNPNAATHFGGGLRISGDKLFFTIGENLNSTDAQDLSTYYGKLMRINLDGSVPSDNPFVGQTGKKPEIWAYGFRNPYKITISPSGQPIVGDVGGDVAEELNIVQKGANYGWPSCEGPCSPANPQMTDPTYSYLHGSTASTSGAVTAGFVYTGNQFPAGYKNTFLFADYVRGYIHSIDLANTKAGESVVDNTAGAAVSLQQAPDGSIYFIDIYPTGALYHIYYSLKNQPPTANIAADKTYGQTPLTVSFSSAGSSDPDNNSITYKWDFGDGSTSTQQNPTHMYTTKGQFTAKLVVNDGSLDSQPVSVNVAPGYAPPTITITSPAVNSKYNADDTISYSATATDPQDGTLPASAYSWTIRMHHLDHYHPFIGPVTGVTNGTFQIPDNAENSPYVSYDITLTVTDSNNLSTSLTRTIYPNLAAFTVQSTPVANLVADVDGIPYATPYTQSTTVGYKIDLKAESPVTRDGTTYQFVSWSDGNTSPERVITIPSTNTTYTAQYQPTVYAMNPGDTKKLPAYSVISGDVKVNGQALYDSDSTTGLVTLLDQTASVSAQWGAVVYTNASQSAGKTSQQQVATQVKANGCGGAGCKSVATPEWPTSVTPPQITPTGTPTPTQGRIAISAGQTVHILANSVIAGDIKANGTILYDNDGTSGLVTRFTTDADVTAPWGATGQTNSDATNAQITTQNMATDMKQHGCGSNCATVTSITYPQNLPTPTPTVYQIQPGATISVPENTVISGDVKVNGQPLYDNDGTSGLVTKFNQTADVTAQWGAKAINTNSPKDASTQAQAFVDDMKQHGCIDGKGCIRVIQINWPDQTAAKPTVTPSPTISPTPTPTITVSEAPSPTMAPTPPVTKSMTVALPDGLTGMHIQSVTAGNGNTSGSCIAGTNPSNEWSIAQTNNDADKSLCSTSVSDNNTASVCPDETIGRGSISLAFCYTNMAKKMFFSVNTQQMATPCSTSNTPEQRANPGGYGSLLQWSNLSRPDFSTSPYYSLENLNGLSLNTTYQRSYYTEGNCDGKVVDGFGGTPASMGHMDIMVSQVVNGIDKRNLFLEVELSDNRSSYIANTNKFNYGPVCNFSSSASATGFIVADASVDSFGQTHVQPGDPARSYTIDILQRVKDEINSCQTQFGLPAITDFSDWKVTGGIWGNENYNTTVVNDVFKNPSITFELKDGIMPLPDTTQRSSILPYNFTPFIPGLTTQPVPLSPVSLPSGTPAPASTEATLSPTLSPKATPAATGSATPSSAQMPSVTPNKIETTSVSAILK